MSCINSLYILDMNPLSDVKFANVFSCLVVCLLILLMASFSGKTFWFNTVPFVYFAFVAFVFGVRLKKYIAKVDIKELAHKFSSRSFMVSSFTLSL